MNTKILLIPALLGLHSLVAADETSIAYPHVIYASYGPSDRLLELRLSTANNSISAATFKIGSRLYELTEAQVELFRSGASPYPSVSTHEGIYGEDIFLVSFHHTDPRDPYLRITVNPKSQELKLEEISRSQP